MAKQVVVYDSYTNQVVFRGSLKECKDWVFNRTSQPFFRHWRINGRYYYDVGMVYYTYEQLID